MAFPRLRLLLVAVLPLAGLTGCFGMGGDGAVPPTVDDVAVNSSASNFTLPDGRGTSAAVNETNKTEDGVGGIEHRHDYWQGAEQVVLVQRNVNFASILPLFPDGQDQGAKSIAYVKIPQPGLVYEGTVEVSVLMKEPSYRVAEGAAAPDPRAPVVKLQYRTASGDAFVDAPPVTFGTAVKIPVSTRETDMPHSVSSLWAFRMTTDGESIADVNLTITAHKGANVVDWPGHPDFYADRDERVIVDKDFKVHRSGIDEFALTGAGSSWVSPDNLISYGTGYLDVFINITSATAANGAPPTGFFLEYHNATILHAEDDFNDRIDDEKKGRAFTHKDYHFVVDVDAAGMDGPYQPSSRWGFRPVATFAETPLLSLCPGCFPYDIEYHLTIVAHKGDDAARING